MKAVSKQATRGQEQIYKENQQTIRQYLLASVVGSGAFLIVHILLVEFAGWKAWTGFSFSMLLEVVALTLMTSSTRCQKGEKGKIVDAGVDLNDSHSFGEYYKDVIILCVIVQLLALISSYFLLVLLLFPAYGSYKLWVIVLGPWFFAQPAEEDPKDEKRQKRRQKVVYRR